MLPVLAPEAGFGPASAGKPMRTAGPESPGDSGPDLGLVASAFRRNRSKTGPGTGPGSAAPGTGSTIEQPYVALRLWKRLDRHSLHTAAGESRLSSLGHDCRSDKVIMSSG
jgi:hypothetical protein